MIDFETFLSRILERVSAIAFPSGFQLINPRPLEGSNQQRTGGDGLDPITYEKYDPSQHLLCDVDFLTPFAAKDVTVYAERTRITACLLLCMGASMQMGTRRVDKIGLLAELVTVLANALQQGRNQLAAQLFSENQLLRTFSAGEAQGLFIPLLRAIYELGHQDAEGGGIWSMTLRQELAKLGKDVFSFLSRKSRSEPNNGTESSAIDDQNNDGETGFCQAVRTLTSAEEKRLVIVFWDFHGMSDEDFAYFEQLSLSHIVRCAILVQPGDYELPPTNGLSTFEDLTTGEAVTVQVDEAEREKYSIRFAKQSQLLLTRLEEAGCQCEVFCTVDPVDEIREKLMSLLTSKTLTRN
jgi:hypothetical protein